MKYLLLSTELKDFFIPKPSVLTTLCQITSHNLQQCCEFFFLVDGRQRNRGPHPLEMSLMFPTGSVSALGHLRVFQVFHCGQYLGQAAAIFYELGDRRGGWFMLAGTVLSRCTWSFGTVDRAIQYTLQERSQSVPGFEVSGTCRSASLGCAGAAKRDAGQPGRWGEVGSQGGRAENETRSSITYPGRTSLAAGRCPKTG